MSGEKNEGLIPLFVLLIFNFWLTVYTAGKLHFIRHQTLVPITRVDLKIKKKTGFKRQPMKRSAVFESNSMITKSDLSYKE